VEFVATVGRKTLVASTFSELGDQLLKRGFQMASASQTNGVLSVPHRDGRKAPALVCRRERVV